MTMVMMEDVMMMMMVKMKVKMKMMMKMMMMMMMPSLSAGLGILAGLPGLLGHAGGKTVKTYKRKVTFTRARTVKR